MPEMFINRSWTTVAAAVLVVWLGLVAAYKWPAVDEPTGGVAPPATSDRATAGAEVGDPLEPSPRTPGGRGKPEARLPPSGEVRAGTASYKVLGGLVSRTRGGSQIIRFFVRTTNVSGRDGFVLTPDSFRLIADGETIPPLDAPSLAMSLQSASENWVMFRASRDTEAAVLQVGDFHQETAKIPIDLRPAGTEVTDQAAPTWRSPVDLAARFEKRVGPFVFSLNGVRLEHFGDAVPPQPEKLVVSFKMRVENLGEKHGAIVSADLFRFIVDDVPLAPTQSPVDALTFQASVEGDVVFVMPGTATDTILQIGNIGAETTKIPIDLSAAH
jgi:hypothetical protein